MAIKIVTNFKNDVDSGKVEIYSPSGIDVKIKDFEQLQGVAYINGMKPLTCAKNLMKMYSLNYKGKPEADERLAKFDEYLKNHLIR